MYDPSDPKQTLHVAWLGLKQLLDNSYIGDSSEFYRVACTWEPGKWTFWEVDLQIPWIIGVKAHLHNPRGPRVTCPECLVLIDYALLLKGGSLD